MKAAEILVLLRQDNSKATLALRQAWGAFISEHLNQQQFLYARGFHSLTHTAEKIYEGSDDIR